MIWGIISDQIYFAISNYSLCLGHKLLLIGSRAHVCVNGYSNLLSCSVMLFIVLRQSLALFFFKKNIFKSLGLKETTRTLYVEVNKTPYICKHILYVQILNKRTFLSV